MHLLLTRVRISNRLPPCTDDEKQLTTPSILTNYCCGRGGSCASDTDCARAESRSGYLPESSTVLELGGSLRDFISVKKSESLGLNRTSFSFAFWARRRTISKRMMVLWHNRPHSNLHIGFHENNAFVFSFTNTAWECPEGDGAWSADANACKGLQTRSTYPDDLNMWVHWAGTYDMPTGKRTIYRNGAPIEIDTAELGLGYSGGDADLHISSGSLTNPSWTNGAFHGSLDDLFVLRRVITGAELAVLVRDRTLSYKDSLVLYLNFEEPTVLCANPRWCAAGQDVTDLSGRNNTGLLHGNWNRSRPLIYEDVVPIDFTCSAPDNAFHNCNSRKALLHDWIKGVCVNDIGADASERVLANLSLPANLQANFTYPLADGDPALLHLMAECSRVCRVNVALASAGCELIIAATSLGAYSFTCCGHDTAARPAGSFRQGSQQVCRICLYTAAHTTVYVSAYYCICFLILHLCPHATMYAVLLDRQLDSHRRSVFCERLCGF